MRRPALVLVVLFVFAFVAGVATAQRRRRGRRPPPPPPTEQQQTPPAGQEASPTDAELERELAEEERQLEEAERAEAEGRERRRRTPRGRARARKSAASREASARAARAHAGSITENLECSACHTPEGWRAAGAAASSGDSGFDHSQTGFPLTGRHDAVGCTSCHATGLDVSRECVTCHVDTHQGRLGRSCERCHNAISWSDTRPIEIHRLTRFPLTGMHALADCTECHQRSGERQWTTVPTECFACHEDDYRNPDVHPSHLGDATSPPFPRDCAACHQPSAWSPAIVDPSILPRSTGLLQPSAPPDHDIRFPITFGKHRRAMCESCHVSLDVPRAVQCTGCHEHNPVRLRAQHGTRALSLDGASCMSCHPGGVAR